MKLITGLVASALTFVVAGCDIDTSALQDIQDTAAQAQATADEINTRSAQAQQILNDPASALRATIGATLTRTATDQPGIYVLTDVQTGCQFLGTYAVDGTTISSIAPRVEATPDGGSRQRCIAIPGVRGADEAQVEAEG